MACRLRCLLKPPPRYVHSRMKSKGCQTVKTIWLGELELCKSGAVLVLRRCPSGSQWWGIRKNFLNVDPSKNTYALHENFCGRARTPAPTLGHRIKTRTVNICCVFSARRPGNCAAGSRNRQPARRPENCAAGSRNRPYIEYELRAQPRICVFETH